MAKLSLALAFLGSAKAQAAGHFDVDDAGMLADGQCQYELWGGRLQGNPATNGVHLGPACGVGPVELGVDFDRISAIGQYAATVAPRVKWTFYGRADGATLSAALASGVAFDVTHGNRAGGQIAIPVSWNPRDDLQINMNLGYSWIPVTGRRTSLAGAQAAWTVNDAVTLIAEHSRLFGNLSSRVGARFSITPTFSVDVSAARIASDAGVSGSVMVGVNQVFGR